VGIAKRLQRNPIHAAVVVESDTEGIVSESDSQKEKSFIPIVVPPIYAVLAMRSPQGVDDLLLGHSFSDKPIGVGRHEPTPFVAVTANNRNGDHHNRQQGSAPSGADDSEAG
jgi:hypothetical protein